MKFYYPKISVIITSYNSQIYLKHSIQSVLNQSFKDFEIILIDDGSKDKSCSIIKKFAKREKKIKFYFFKNNSGTASIPRNKGAELAKGKYLCFLDADDIWLSDKLEEQLKMISKRDVFSFTSCKYIKKSGKNYSNFMENYVRNRLQSYFFKIGLKGLFAYNPVILSSVLIEKSFFLKFKFNTSKSLVGIEDLDLWLRIFYSTNSKKISFCNKELVLIRRTPDSLNINYTQAVIRASYCVIKFFLEKKIFNTFKPFLIGIILRSLKNLIKISQTPIKKNFIKFFLIFSIIYISIFKTPIFWYAGKFLTYWDEPVNSDAIVILSGNGEADYINTGYQRRYLDVKKIVNSNNFKTIYLMGRKQEIEEYNILKALLIADGVDNQKIKVVTKTFRNTKENIRSLVEILKKDNINSINFVTAPYHTKRSKLLWDKYNDGIKVNILENIDRQKNKKWKKVTYTQLKVILYEFTAIVYNKLRGYF